TMPSWAPTTARPYPSARPGRRPKRAIIRASGQLASAVPSAPTAMGMPIHALVPMISAAMIPPTAIAIEWPVLPQTWAANSAPISRARDHPATALGPAIAMTALPVEGIGHTALVPARVTEVVEQGSGHLRMRGEPVLDQHAHARVNL